MSLEQAKIRKAIQEQYGAVARGQSSDEPSESCCAPTCCQPDANQNSINIGYATEALADLPQGADMGLGCGNPSLFASFAPGEVVLDLGSGGGIDAFLAAKVVGETGQVIGVDMTADMIELSRANAAKAGVKNVDFRLGEIENLPVSDASVNVIMSNCVVNLSTNKPRVFEEAYRVLKPGGRLAISDVLADKPMPQSVRDNVEAHVGCIAGAATIDETVAMLKSAGFSQIEVIREESSKQFIKEWLPESGLEEFVVSAKVQATK